MSDAAKVLEETADRFKSAAVEASNRCENGLSDGFYESSILLRARATELRAVDVPQTEASADTQTLSMVVRAMEIVEAHMRGDETSDLGFAVEPMRSWIERDILRMRSEAAADTMPRPEPLNGEERKRLAQFLTREADAQPTSGRPPLPKPERVETGQMWLWAPGERIERVIDDDHGDRICLVDGGGGYEESRLLADPRWLYLGVDAPPGGG